MNATSDSEVAFFLWNVEKFFPVPVVFCIFVRLMGKNQLNRQYNDNIRTAICANDPRT